jgi:hypothetical protein
VPELIGIDAAAHDHLDPGSVSERGRVAESPDGDIGGWLEDAVVGSPVATPRR